VILLSIVAGQPRELGLIAMIKLFIEHRMEVVRRRTIFELRKAEEREHISGRTKSRSITWTTSSA